MEIKPLTTGLSVSAQIISADMQAIKDAGFRAIICNRPDGEGADQPTLTMLRPWRRFLLSLLRGQIGMPALVQKRARELWFLP